MNRPHSSGDRCPQSCGGQLVVRTSRTTGAFHVRYLSCNRCGAQGGKSLVSADRVIRPERPKS